MFNRKIIEYLKTWQNKPHRKPLILRGARQVGKTSAVKYFAQENFQDLIYINLDKAEDYEAFKDVQSLDEFKQTVEIVLRQKLTPGSSLVFIDEIQNAPNLIALLRFFYEDEPAMHVIAAGSLLEVKLAQEGFAIPVGRVEYAYMYPLTFFEFLGASGEAELLSFLKKVKPNSRIPASVHFRALKLFYNYALLGGMPEIIALHLASTPQEEINTLYSSLLTAYQEDIYKYASEAEAKYIRHVLEQTPYYVGQRITYQKFGHSQYRSREMSQAFEILEKAMIVRQLPATQSKELPLTARPKRAKKLIYLDNGFVNFRNNIQARYIKLDDLNSLYRGKAAEQIVGQSLTAYFEHEDKPIYYWARQKPQGAAEIDFCLSHQGSVLGLEVKSGSAGKLKSLLSFAQNTPKARLIRIYSGKLKQEKLSRAGQSYPLLSVPFYLVDRVLELV